MIVSLADYKKKYSIPEKYNNSVTIVTAFFDIGRGNWDSYTVSNETYISWMRNILWIDIKLIIYTESKFAKDITEHRIKVDPDFSKTKLIILDLDKTDGYNIYYDSVSDVMGLQSFKSKILYDVPEMNKPLYNIIQFSKINFIYDSFKNGYLNSDFYIWSDAGCLREEPVLNRQWPNQGKIDNLNKDKIHIFSHHENIDIESKNNHILSQMRYTQGTFFIVPIKLISRFKNLFISTVFEYLCKDLIGSDEKILDFCYLKDKELFNITKCNWREYYNILN